MNFILYLNFYFVKCDKMKRHCFDVRTTIKIKIKDIETKFNRVAIFKNQIFYYRFKCRNDYNTNFFL